MVSCSKVANPNKIAGIWGAYTYSSTHPRSHRCGFVQRRSDTLGVLLHRGEPPVTLYMSWLTNKQCRTSLLELCIFFALANNPARKRDRSLACTSELSQQLSKLVSELSELPPSAGPHTILLGYLRGNLRRGCRPHRRNEFLSPLQPHLRIRIRAANQG